MCGIAAILRLDGGAPDMRALTAMTDAIAHRGPDDSGTFQAGPVAFGFRRLSILDLSPAGHQPMATPGGEAVIVFNGEIYNFIELRAELEGKGHRFVSRSDTEVLLHAYLEWGEACLGRLNGMFAFIIYDARAKTLFGARDRFGVKPLYVYRDGRNVLFASEIKAIRASGLAREAGVNWVAATDYLLHDEADATPQSFFKDIHQISPGHAFTCAFDGTITERRYWSIDAAPGAHADPHAAEAFAELFEDSVRLRMRSDVPVGVCLSGGLDSTSIICAMARSATDAPALNAFCFADPEYDESAYLADTLSQVAAVPHYAALPEDRIWEGLARMVAVQDEPVHSLTPLIGLELMRLAAENGVKVVLNGQGADEVCAGYPPYFTNYWQGMLRRGAWAAAAREIEAYAAAHPGAGQASMGRQIQLFVRNFVRKIPPYDALSVRYNLRALRAHPWFTPELTRHACFDARTHGISSLDTALRRSVERNPLPLYWRVEDRKSMAHSVEVRLPFMDFRLVAFTFGLPDEMKTRGPWNKFVLREAMRRRIPESVRSRVAKMGFPVPQRRWVAGMLYEPIRDLLSSRAARERGLYNFAAIDADLERHRRGDIDISIALLRVCQFELWNRNVLAPAKGA